MTRALSLLAALALAALLAGCGLPVAYVIAPATGIPEPCWATERTDTGFTCVDKWHRTWWCRWVQKGNVDGVCTMKAPKGGRV